MPSLLNTLLPLTVASGYRLVGEFDGNFDGTFCIAISPSGDTIATGGEGGIMLWDVKKMRRGSAALPEKKSGNDAYGTVTCARWMEVLDGVDKTLVFGSSRGHLCLWRNDANRYRELYNRRLGSGVELVCLTLKKTSSSSTRLAVGTREGNVQVFLIRSLDAPEHLFSVNIDNVIPKELSFVAGKRNDIYVFGLFDGIVYLLKSGDGTAISTTKLPTPIGSAAVDHDANEFVIDNITQGFSLHRFGHSRAVRIYETMKPCITQAKQVAFAEDGRVVVGGSEHGVVYIFDRLSGLTLATLHHGSGMVQTIATQDQGHETLIVSASSASGKGFIRLWKGRKTCLKRAALVTRRRGNSPSTFGIIQVLLLSILLAALITNFEPMARLSEIWTLEFFGWPGRRTLWIAAEPTAPWGLEWMSRFGWSDVEGKNAKGRNVQEDALKELRDAVDQMSKAREDLRKARHALDKTSRKIEDSNAKNAQEKRG